MDIKNLEKELSIAQIDPKANIKLVKISGNSEISVFAAQVSPHTHLNPHYHKVGIEIYQIYQGQGEMKVGSVIKDSVIWEETFKINQGYFFIIEAGKVNQL